MEHSVGSPASAPGKLFSRRIYQGLGIRQSQARQGALGSGRTLSIVTGKLSNFVVCIQIEYRRLSIYQRPRTKTRPKSKGKKGEAGGIRTSSCHVDECNWQLPPDSCVVPVIRFISFRFSSVQVRPRGGWAERNHNRDLAAIPISNPFYCLLPDIHDH